MSSANAASNRPKRVRLKERRKTVGLSQEALADRIGVSTSTVRRWEAGEHPPQPFLRPKLAEALGVSLEELEFLLVRSGWTEPAPPIVHDQTAPGSTVESLAETQGAPMDRREFMALAGTTLVGAVVSPAAVLQDLALVLVDPRRTAGAGADLTLASLEPSVFRMKQAYQACQYDVVAAELPDVLARLKSGADFVVGDDRLRMSALAAQAHHVAASVLLKLDGHGLAAVAADRSLEAAHRSEDPLMIGASARIVTHTLMDSGQYAAAHQFAEAKAIELSREVEKETEDSISVYGAPLLRGAVAAGQGEASDSARTLLDEAEEAARRIGGIANHQWTAFCPDNVLAHRVAVEISLGNAGTAVEHLRKIKLGNLGIDERKATVCIDAARAFTQWGKYDTAVSALHAAEDVSSQELRVRPVARELVQQIRVLAPASVQSSLNTLVDRVGIAA